MVIFSTGVSVKLDVSLIPLGVFDPWLYDTDGNCYIEFIEWVKASNDYSNGLITRAQYDQVAELYQYKTRNPSCPDGGNGDLLSRLKSGEVGANWWNYSSAERWEIAHYVGEYCADLPIGEQCAIGAKDCAGAPFSSKRRCVCHHHVCIRYSIIGNSDTCGISSYGWSCHENYWQDTSGNWHCLYNPQGFRLPMHWGSLSQRWFTTPPGTPLINHAICALQVESDTQDFNSWLFFQYTDAKIVPLDKNVKTANRMEVGTMIAIREIVKFNGFYDIKSEPKPGALAGWEITEAGAIPFYGPWEK